MRRSIARQRDVPRINKEQIKKIFLTMGSKVTNRPSAFYLMDSMRNIGYSFNSALADIVDNSISAGAKNINIIVPADPNNLYLGFLDDGKGMNGDDLRIAMRYGSKGKEQERDEMDLGRYGLGLKSASLSQCRKLTVASKIQGKLFAACWDLNVVAESEEWTLLELDDEEINSLPSIELLKAKEQGTLVLWQDFDTIRQSYGGLEYKGLIDLMDEALDYLSLIFHRFISGHGVNIAVNALSLDPLDPFLEKHHKTEIGKVNDITVQDKNGVDRHISVTTYLLPYLKDLTEEDMQALGGARKLASMQGFYVYRNERLIIYGTWFRMSYRSELAKYARIKVDIPATLDEIWKIDIKKQSAELPPAIKRQLQQCVESAQFSSRRKNKHRLTLKQDDVSSIWQKNESRSKKAVYRINRDAPLVKTILQQCDLKEAQLIQTLLAAIEQSVPYHDMYTDEANDNIDSTLSEEDMKGITIEAIGILNILENLDGRNTEVALTKLMAMKPYSEYDWIEASIRKELGL